MKDRTLAPLYLPVANHPSAACFSCGKGLYSRHLWMFSNGFIYNENCVVYKCNNLYNKDIWYIRNTSLFADSQVICLAPSWVSLEWDPEKLKKTSSCTPFRTYRHVSPIKVKVVNPLNPLELTCGYLRLRHVLRGQMEKWRTNGESPATSASLHS